MSFHQARCKSTLSELILIFQDLFSWVENFFGRSRNFFTGRVFLRVEFFVWPVDNFLHWSRNFFIGREFFVGREIFLSVENFLAGRECFSWSRSFLVCRSREIREAGREISVGSEVFAPERSACKSKENCFR